MVLLPHNEQAYNNVVAALETSNRTCVVHPTGTGKSYIALQLIKDNPGKKILYVTSYVSNLLQFADDFRELVETDSAQPYFLYFSVYGTISLEVLYDPETLTLTEDDIVVKKLPESIFSYSYDYILLDEFHRAGAPQWQQAVNGLLALNPNAKIVGFSATPVRYLDNNRDMALELFHGNIASRIPLKKAIVDKLLPMPEYIMASYSLDDFVRTEEKLEKGCYREEDKANVHMLLEAARRRMENAVGLDKLFETRMKNPRGRYIVFCRNIDHLCQMVEESKDWFAWAGEVHRYELYSSQDDEIPYGPYRAFVSDNTDCLRLLFCVNMVNEGVHVPEANAILLRPTQSLNVYFQQLGRALTVGQERTIQIFDIVNNAQLLQPVTKFWSEVRQSYKEKNGEYEGSFEVFDRDLEILNLLHNAECYAINPWDYYYDICRKFYEANGHLRVPFSYYVDGHSIWSWLSHQRQNKERLSEEQIKLLDAIGMKWIPESMWYAGYRELVEFKEREGHLYGPFEEQLSKWVSNTRHKRVLGELQQDRIDLLDSIGFEWDGNRAQSELSFRRGLKAATEYYEENGNLNVPKPYWVETDNGEDRFDLGGWIPRMRNQRDEIPETWVSQLNAIHMIWDLVAYNKRITWLKNFELAKSYYQIQGHLVPKTEDVELTQNGFLQTWLKKQRCAYKAGELSQEQIELLNSVEMIWDLQAAGLNSSWMKSYEKAKQIYLRDGEYKSTDPWYFKQTNDKMYGRITPEREALLNKINIVWREHGSMTDGMSYRWKANYEFVKKYYEEHGNLDVPGDLAANDTNVQKWLREQRYNRKKGILSQTQIDLMDALGYEWGNKKDTEWLKNYELLKTFDNPNISDTQEIDGVKIGAWLHENKVLARKGKLSERHKQLLEDIGVTFDEMDSADEVSSSVKWEKSYNEFAKYVKEQGTVIVPKDYIAGNGTKLIGWVHRMRRWRRQGKLSDYQIKKLDLLGFAWEPQDEAWRTGYAIAKAYAQEFGNLNVIGDCVYRDFSLGGVDQLLEKP